MAQGKKAQPSIEVVTVRERQRRGGRPREGLDHTWTEWQVVAGRRVISRHDLPTQAEQAADKFQAERALRIAALQRLG